MKRISIQFLLVSATLLYGIEDCVKYIPMPAVNHFSIVIDRSGSMHGDAMDNAKKAANHFIDQMKVDDQANVIAFDGSVSIVSGMGTSKSGLKSSVNNIRPGGATALYDAIAKAATTLYSENGAKIIVFLTDGEDTGSKFRLKDLESMNLSEGVFIYGIGLGNINTSGLDNLASATGGTFHAVSSPSDLYNIYDRVINTYYNDFGNKMATTASITIRSLPSNQQVLINNLIKGRTPLKIDGLSIKDYDVQVQFSKGTWQCDVKAKQGQRAVMDARESDLGYDLFISSTPKGASVFVDGDYVGMTSVGVTEYKVKKRWFRKDKKTKKYDSELLVPLIPPGKHRLRILAVPDLDMGLEYEFSFDIKTQNRFVDVNIFKQTHQFTDGETGKKKKDPFKALDGF